MDSTASGVEPEAQPTRERDSVAFPRLLPIIKLKETPVKSLSEQLDFRFPCSWGGARIGAGRPRGPRSRRRRVPHSPRPIHRKSYPLHVTLRARWGLPPFREQVIFRSIRDALEKASRSPRVGDGFRVIHFSVQRDHLHLIVEAHDSSSRSRGMQGLAIRVARAVNRLLRNRGNVWKERYHAHTLRTPREVRNAIVYVLMNAKKHGVALAGIDALSSAPFFDGIARIAPIDVHNGPVAAPRTWLAGVGWRRLGLIDPRERPLSGARSVQKHAPRRLVP